VKAAFGNEDFQALAQSVGDKPCQVSSAFLWKCAISLCQLPWAAVPDACSHVAGGYRSRGRIYILVSLHIKDQSCLLQGVCRAEGSPPARVAAHTREIRVCIEREQPAANELKTASPARSNFCTSRSGKGA